MSQMERVYRLSHLLGQGQCLPKQRLLDELGVSFATLKRDFMHLRDRSRRTSKASCLGLIEAPHSLVASPVECVTSKASRLGLIEAGKRGGIPASHAYTSEVSHLGSIEAPSRWARSCSSG